MRNLVGNRNGLAFPVLFAAIALFSSSMKLFAIEEAPPGDAEAKTEAKKDDKPEGPEHEVLLNEDDEVKRLIRRAEKARADAEAGDTSAWPICVKAYADVLRKHPNAVYLDRWAGDGQADAKSYGLGVYRSVWERVSKDLAALPPTGLKIYQAVNDGEAGRLYREASAALDVRRMEQVAAIFFSTSWGDDAAAWLAEHAHGEGADRRAVQYLRQLLTHPSPSVPMTAALSRLAPALARLGEITEARKVLAELERLLQAEPDRAQSFSLGNASGAQAAELLRKMIEKVAENQTPKTTLQPEALETYYGNAAHHRLFAGGGDVGVRIWSIPIPRLFGAPPGAKIETEFTFRNPYNNTSGSVTPYEYFPVFRDGRFFLFDGQTLVCHNLNNPNPDRPIFKVGRTFATVSSGARTNLGALLWSPQFCTLGEDHVYAVFGPRLPAAFSSPWGGGMQAKPMPNYLAAFGKKPGGKLGVESGYPRWSLEPDSAEAKKANDKEDREWLKTVSFTCSPTYAGGMLYVPAINLSGGTGESWLTAFDAATGRLLWRTLLCSGKVASTRIGLQPNYGLPPAVGGGSVYCVTNLGAVAAVNASSGHLRWVRIYEREKSAGPDRWGRPNVGAVADSWAPNPPVLIGNRLLITPQDSPSLYVLEADTGRRLWEKSRSIEMEFGRSEKMVHLIGVAADRYPIFTGNCITVFDLQGGKLVYQQDLRDTCTLLGCGTTGHDAALIASDKGLLRFDLRQNASGRPSFKMLPMMPWKDDHRMEAGNVFVIGDTVVTVGPATMNAYCVVDSLEKRLRSRLEANPSDFEAYAEAGDVFLRAQQFDVGLKYLDEGLALAEKERKDDAVRDLRRRKADLLTVAGNAARKEGKPEAARLFSSALEFAVEARQKSEALAALAETLETDGKTEEAVRCYRRLLTEQGDELLRVNEQTLARAGAYAAFKIGKLLRSKPADAWSALEAEAKKELDAAQDDLDAHFTAARNWPHTNAAADALAVVIERSVKSGKTDLALRASRLFLSWHPRHPFAPEATAVTAALEEQGNRLVAAKNALGRLLHSEAPLKNPDAGGVSASAWAKKKLSALPASDAPVGLGAGLLRKTWGKPTEAPILLQTTQPAPERLRGSALSIENGRVMVRSRLTGEPVWQPSPRAPAGLHPQAAAWRNATLILVGAREMAAFDATRNGVEAWRAPLRQVAADPNSEKTVETVFYVHNDRIFIVYADSFIQAFDATDGTLLWETRHVAGQFFGKPAVGDDFLVIGANNPGGAVVLDAATGLSRGVLEAEARLVLPPQTAAGKIFFVENSADLCAADAGTLKRIWRTKLEGAPTTMAVGRERLALVIGGRNLHVFDFNGKARWNAQPSGNRRCGNDLAADGDQILAAYTQGSGEGRLYAYEAESGKLAWEAAIQSVVSARGGDGGALNVINAGGGNVRIVVNGREISDSPAGAFLNAEPFGGLLTQNHVLVRNNLWDASKQSGAGVALLDRRTGKITWTMGQPSRHGVAAVTVEGGLVLWDGRELSGWFAEEPERFEKELARMRQAANDKPGDISLLLNLAQACAERNLTEEAVRTSLAAVKAALAGTGADAGRNFQAAYEVYQRHRLTAAELGLDRKLMFFAPMKTPPKCDGVLDEWAKIPALTFDDWPDVYLAGPEDTGEAFRATQWKGKDDLGATFRGGYDDKHLYFAVEVRDDIHLNEKDDPARAWAGDCVQFAFSIAERPERKPGYRQGDGEFGIALAKDGKTLTWSICENGRYTVAKLEMPAAVKRDEAAKTTTYEFAFPIALSGIEPTRGKTFSFSFCVNDLDKGDRIEKCVGPSPGIWEPKFPARFALGILGLSETDKAEK
jgi:outer membrane protein assembly factor BamB